jgi:hypothetical protein
LLRLGYRIRLSRSVAELGHDYGSSDRWSDVLVNPIENVLLAPKQLSLTGQSHDWRQAIEALRGNVCVDGRRLSVEERA